MMTNWFTRGFAVLGLAGVMAVPALASYPESDGVQNTNANASPSTDASNVNNYVNQDEQINLLPTDGLVKVLRTDQKNLVNDYVTKTIPVKNANIRELRNVVRRMVALEGGRAEAIKNPEAGKGYIEVVAPGYMIPYIEDAIANLDVQWLKEYWDGGADIYLKMQHRDAALVDAMASNYGSAEGLSAVDTTNNSVRRFDQPARNEKYTQAVGLIDIPPNQVELEVKVYEVTASNDLKLGVDYIAWKNGPGRNLFSFASAGYQDFQRSRGKTSIYDPYVNGYVDIPSNQKVKVADFDGRESYRSANYLLTSNFVDFLQSKGQARVINSQKLMLMTSKEGTIGNTEQVAAITNNLNEVNSDFTAKNVSRTNSSISPYAYLAEETRANLRTATLEGVSVTFIDANANGILDKNEAVLSDKGLFIDKNANGVLDDNETLIGPPNGSTSSPEGDVSTPIADYGRKVEYTNVGEVGMSLTLKPSVGLESMELAVKMEIGELNGYAPSGTPIINTRTVDSTVRLLDGQPFVLAGLTRKHDLKSTNKAPWLGSVPVLGYLFGGEQDLKRDNDVLVVITPRFHLANEVNLATPPHIKTLDLMVKREKAAPAQGIPGLTFGYDQWLLDRS